MQKLPQKKKCCGKYRNRTITDYGNPSKIKMQRKMETKWAQLIYKKRGKTVEHPFGNIKQNFKLIEFNRTGLQGAETEAKIITIGHNLKRIYNEIGIKTTKTNKNN